MYKTVLWEWSKWSNESHSSNVKAVSESLFFICIFHNVVLIPHNIHISNSAVNRIYPAKLHIPSPHHQPPTMSLEVGEMTAAQKKWKCFYPTRKLLLTSHLFYLPSSGPLGLIFWLALHSRCCKMSSLSSTPSYSGKEKKQQKSADITNLCHLCYTTFASCQ